MTSSPIDLKLEDIVSTNEKMARCLKLAALAASSEVPVLILGETGTGKTLLARAIHNSSARARRPFISFNASALSDTLLESDLFGHERGAFTGALKMVKGKFELADTGSLFLDEIADMSPLAQVKILRAVEYGEFERLGAERMLHSDVRVISASNRPLRELARDGKFREDLYHRLNGVTLVIPPLRERREELRGLIAIELQAAAAAAKKKITSIHPSAMDALLNHRWDGNLRELNHVMRTVVLFCGGKVVLPEHVILDAELNGTVHPAAASPSVGKQVPSPVLLPGENDASLSAAIHRHVRSVYEASGRNQRLTARLLGISRGKLARQLSKLASK
jgi:transcriptional regulator with PAS, ATPase and Fis domain